MPRPRTPCPTRRSSDLVLQGRDDRLIVVVGPCSIHDHDQAMDYARQLKAQADALAGELLVVMRVYFEKPRTTVGWKGYINDPRSEEHTSELQSLRHLVCHDRAPLALHDALPISCCRAGTTGSSSSSDPAPSTITTRPWTMRASSRPRPTPWPASCSWSCASTSRSPAPPWAGRATSTTRDRKSTRLNSSHLGISYATTAHPLPYTTLFRSRAAGPGRPAHRRRRTLLHPRSRPGHGLCAPAQGPGRRPGRRAARGHARLLREAPHHRGLEGLHQRPEIGRAHV